jgi:hypothetical protein
MIRVATLTEAVDQIIGIDWSGLGVGELEG